MWGMSIVKKGEPKTLTYLSLVAVVLVLAGLGVLALLAGYFAFWCWQDWHMRWSITICR